MQTVGFNVEWSQELRLEQSLEEYVKGALLIRMLAACGALPLAPGMDRTVFDISVGYDLAGITSERVLAFLHGMQDPTSVVDRLRHEVPPELGHLRDVDLPAPLSGSVMLSTFHGCPPDEIERIAAFLMRDLGLHCTIKLNPTLLGPAELRGLLHDALGYTDLRVPDEAFTSDTTWDQAAGFVDRLGALAESLGLGFGVKCTNTLIVENHRAFFPASERVMYLSGRPLHVLAMHLVRRLRRMFGGDLPISFSAGVDRHNFADTVALGLVPVTVCSDLLQPGGYGRAHGYIAALTQRMAEVSAVTIDEFVLMAAGSREPGAGSGEQGAGSGEAGLATARLRNTESYVERVARDPRYAAPANLKVPRKIGRRLHLFDCLTCDKCIPVCPNDANFTYVLPSTPELPVTEARQIANFADFCNDCGNCDIFCPEDGGPQQLKPRLFTDRVRWEADAPRDAILVEPDATTGRFDGAVVRVGAGSGADSADPRERLLSRLRDALLASTEINYVNHLVTR
jgi:putative selenate reductase